MSRLSSCFYNYTSTFPFLLSVDRKVLGFWVMPSGCESERLSQEAVSLGGAVGSAFRGPRWQLHLPLWFRNHFQGFVCSGDGGTGECEVFGPPCLVCSSLPVSSFPDMLQRIKGILRGSSQIVTIRGHL